MPEPAPTPQRPRTPELKALIDSSLRQQLRRLRLILLIFAPLVVTAALAAFFLRPIPLALRVTAGAALFLGFFAAMVWTIWPPRALRLARLNQTEYRALVDPALYNRSIGWGAGFWILGVLTWFMLGPAIFNLNPLQHLMPLFFGVGFMLIALGFARRRSVPLSCAKCLYNLDSFTTLPDRCPECGVGLGTQTSTTTIARHRSPALIAVGVIILALIVADFVAKFNNTPFLGGLVTKGLPTPALIPLAAESDEAFTEITSRPLTPAQRTALVESILAAAADKTRSYRIPNQLTWLGAEFTAGRLSPEQSARFLGNWQNLAIERLGPPPRVGQPLTLELTGDSPRLPAGISDLVAFGGWFIGDDPAPIDASKMPVSGNQLSSFAREYAKTAPPLPLIKTPEHPEGVAVPAAPSLTITPDRPGPLRVRARVVLITSTKPNWLSAITWNSDGSFTLLSPADWHEERTLELILDVRP